MILADTRDDIWCDQWERCKRCLKRQKWAWAVDDDTWAKVVQGRWSLLCLECFDDLAAVVGVDYRRVLMALTFVGWMGNVASESQQPAAAIPLA